MVLPTLISVSDAPGPYFFSAAAGTAIMAAHSATSHHRELVNPRIALSSSDDHACRPQRPRQLRVDHTSPAAALGGAGGFPRHRRPCVALQVRPVYLFANSGTYVRTV